jgi:hypothetical protein
LGHVFTNRSVLPSSSDATERDNGLLFAAVNGTFSGNCSSSFDETNSPDPFSNMTFEISSCSSINDVRGSEGLVMGRRVSEGWRRGERGWGSGPDNIYSPFQQHPPDHPDFLSDDDPIRVDETAADMFLNWVYRRRTNNPPSYAVAVPGSWEGFLNLGWLNNATSGTADPNYPGDARFEWMNRVISHIFSLKGW